MLSPRLLSQVITVTWPQRPWTIWHLLKTITASSTSWTRALIVQLATKLLPEVNQLTGCRSCSCSCSCFCPASLSLTLLLLPSRFLLFGFAFFFSSNNIIDCRLCQVHSTSWQRCRPAPFYTLLTLSVNPHSCPSRRQSRLSQGNNYVLKALLASEIGRQSKRSAKANANATHINRAVNLTAAAHITYNSTGMSLSLSPTHSHSLCASHTLPYCQSLLLSANFCAWFKFTKLKSTFGRNGSKSARAYGSMYVLLSVCVSVPVCQWVCVRVWGYYSAYID